MTTTKGGRTLLVDNYDSYTFNLFQMLAVINGSEPIVIRNDSMSDGEALALLPHVDNVVISPGPGRPERESDFGVCAALLRQERVPVLGVCLGHQGLAHVNGGRVIHAPEPMHGRLSVVKHDGTSPLFSGIPLEFSVVRYHSLIVTDLPECVRPVAWTNDADQIIMAVEHTRLPQWGVQFHPESISTQYGSALLSNFVDAALKFYRRTDETLPPVTVIPRPLSLTESIIPSSTSSPLHILHKRLDRLHSADTESIYFSLFDQNEHAFWLDSARIVPGMSRFSFMGAIDGPLAFWSRADKPNSPRTFGGPAANAARLRDTPLPGTDQGFFAWLTREVAMAQARLVKNTSYETLPFEFRGGFVTTLGYELRDECGSPAAAVCEDVPVGFAMFADRVLVYDHVDNIWWALCVVDDDGLKTTWMDDIENRAISVVQGDGNRIGKLADDPVPSKVLLAEHLRSNAPEFEGIPVRLARGRTQYLSDVLSSQTDISNGETYEVCVTTQLDIDVAHVDASLLYRRLRRMNAAPYGALIKLGGGVAVASSSPERFLKVTAKGEANCKPIKGTAPRGETPEEDERLRNALATSVKDAAENLMIVDLIRHDLGLVCLTGTVLVPRLLHIESYTTVHQLVSTITGTLRPSMTAVECARACFPPGSMTGAPKNRTMQIIDRIEQGRPRGIYSGAIGYFGIDGGADMAVVIRTAVVTKSHVTGGAGGAVVALSGAEEEFEEMTLKAGTFLPSVIMAAKKAVNDKNGAT